MPGTCPVGQEVEDVYKRQDYTDKENLITWLPDFVTKEDFDWAIEEAAKKKKEDYSKAEFLTYDEGLCVQCMHCLLYTSRCV